MEDGALRKSKSRSITPQPGNSSGKAAGPTNHSRLSRSRLSQSSTVVSITNDPEIQNAIRSISTKSPITEICQKLGDMHVPDFAKDQIKKLLHEEGTPEANQTKSQPEAEDLSLSSPHYGGRRPSSAPFRSRIVSFANISPSRGAHMSRPATSMGTNANGDSIIPSHELVSLRKVDEQMSNGDDENQISAIEPLDDDDESLFLNQVDDDGFLNVAHVPAAWAPSSLSFSIPEQRDYQRSAFSRLRERKIRLENLRKQLVEEESVKQTNSFYMAEQEARKEEERRRMKLENERKFRETLDEAKKLAEAEKLEKRRLRESQKAAQKEFLKLHNLEQRRADLEKKKIKLSESKRLTEEAIQNESRTVIYDTWNKEKLKKIDRINQKHMTVEQRLQEQKMLKEREIRIKKLQEDIKQEEAAIRKHQYEQQMKARPEWINRFQRVGENVASIQGDYLQRVDNSKTYHDHRQTDNESMFQNQEMYRRIRLKSKESTAIQKAEASRHRVQQEAKEVAKENTEKHLLARERKQLQEEAHSHLLQDVSMEISQKLKRIDVIQAEKREHEKVM
eukprot:TRINITY_DN895_c0_g1_i5.p1 TRINITY_DN895_c0_g1~~TRINITY_DN895_c0_g1_i5.p1  ORF type:complete len:563 (-),score=160.51 TRINITY_DN895_c0_g1_i5:722-2410(-)